MKTATVRAMLLLLLVGMPWSSGAETTAETASSNNFEQTVLRFFAGMTSYEEGDLIVQSQVEELQDYLRKTRGRSRATQPVLLKRVLADHSPLARLFYTPEGGPVLRSAAEKLGTYAGLDRLSRTSTGRRQLNEAIHDGNADRLVKILAEGNQSTHRTADDHPEHVPRLKRRIYTVKQFLLAVQPQRVSSSATVAPSPAKESP